MGLEIDARTPVAGRHGDVDQHFALQTLRGGHLLERLEEDVEPLVVELVAAARADDERLFLVFAAQARFGHGDHRAARLGTLGVVLLARPHEVVFEAVGRYAVGLAAQQVFAFVGRDIAHGQELVEVRGGHLLDRVLGRDVELAGQLVGVEFRQVVI